MCSRAQSWPINRLSPAQEWGRITRLTRRQNEWAASSVEISPVIMALSRVLDVDEADLRQLWVHGPIFRGKVILFKRGNGPMDISRAYSGSVMFTVAISRSWIRLEKGLLKIWRIMNGNTLSSTEVAGSTLIVIGRTEPDRSMVACNWAMSSHTCIQPTE